MFAIKPVGARAVRGVCFVGVFAFGVCAMAQDRADGSAGASPSLVEATAVALDPHIVFERVIVGADGVARVTGADDGGIAGAGERLIYGNTLGIQAMNFPTNQPVSDDIATTAPDGCALKRYRFKVMGKVLPTGLSGAYTVNYGLYTNCPIAVGSTNAQRDLVRIPGTEGVLSFPDDAPRLIEHVVIPAQSPVLIPTNVYLGLRFNRGNCGTVVGAPAMIGYSGDIWDFPGFPCNGFLGGFPELPHASFWLEMFGSDSCADAFVGYKAQRPSGGVAFLGANVQGVDDAKLIVNNCQMIGYEVAVKGVGLYTFDLRRDCDGQIIAGTERTFQVNANTTPLLQVARFAFDPPITLTTDSLFLGFKCSSNSAGAVVAGIVPIIGESGMDYFTIGVDGCTPVLPTQGVHGAVNLAITCAGTMPTGACCDPHLTQCNEGEDSEKRCLTNSDCSAPGTCEAVCRETTELNCPFPPKGQELRPKWQVGEACEPDPFLPNACGVAACCHKKPNPQNPNILDEVCENLTKNGCDAAIPTDQERLWQLGEYCGLNAQACPREPCLARDGSCYVAHDTPGCSDPFCCSMVCASGSAGAFCCNTQWDWACVALAEHYCSQDINDQCAPDFPVRGFQGALGIPVPGSQTVDNRRATTDSIEPGFCCNNGTGVCVGGKNAGEPCVVSQDCLSGVCSEPTPDPGAQAPGSIWFKFVQPAGLTTAGIHTCTSNAPAQDSILQVFSAGDNSSQLAACNSLSVIGCNDDAPNCGSTQRNSRLCLRNLVPGATYYVLVAAKTENRMGQYRVSISTNCTGGNDVVANDYCHRAADIVDATPVTPNESTTPFTLAGATFDCPAASCTPGAQNDVWFDYTATCTGKAHFETCGADSNSSPDTNLVVYTGCEQCSPNSLVEIGCNQDAYLGCGLGSRVTVDATEGECFKVRVADNEGFAVSGNLTIRCEPLGACCDWVNTDENGEAVCRDVPLSECPEPPSGEPQWIEGVSCESALFDPPCGVAACCHLRPNPQNPDILDEVCVNMTKNECESQLQEPNPPIWQRGEYCGLNAQICPRDPCLSAPPPRCFPGECRCIEEFCDSQIGSFCCNMIWEPACCAFLEQVCKACPVGVVSIIDPPRNVVDARRPFPPNNPQFAEGIKMIVATGPSGATADCWSVCESPAAPASIQLASVDEGPAGTYSIQLNRAITPGAVTMLTYSDNDGGKSVGRFIAHPGNVNGDSRANTHDILALVDYLNGVGPLPWGLYSGDLDHSGVIGPADILTLIDLLNGTNGFAAWYGTALPDTEECP